MNSGETSWEPGEIDRLRALWAQGMSTAAIGRALKRSKSSVVGKSHRLKLPRRPNPIGGAPKKQPAADAPALHVVMPTERATNGGRMVSLADKHGASHRPAVVGRTLSLAFPPPPPEPVRAPHIAGSRTCTWPMWKNGERGGPDFPTCDAPVRMKLSPRGERVPCQWCDAHARIGYIMPRVQAEA